MAERTNEPPDDAFAGAEEAAAREAAELAAAEDAPPKPKVAKPRATTTGGARRRQPQPDSPAERGRPVMDPSAIGRVEHPADASDPGTSSALQARAVQPDEIITTDSLTLTGGGIQRASARTINIRQGGIGRLEADEVAVSQGGIGAARADHVSVELGGIGAVLAGEVRVTQGIVNNVAARDVAIEQSFIRSVIANRVTFGRTTGAFLVVARRVDGEVRTLLDWRGAAAFGAAFGLIVGLFRRGRR